MIILLFGQSLTMAFFFVMLKIQSTSTWPSRMSQLQPVIQLQSMAEPLLNIQEMQFWLDKAVAWGQADSPDTQGDTCLHLNRLRDLLQQLLTNMNNTVSYCEKKFSFLLTLSHQDLYSRLICVVLVLRFIFQMPVTANKMVSIH